MMLPASRAAGMLAARCSLLAQACGALIARRIGPRVGTKGHRWQEEKQGQREERERSSNQGCEGPEDIGHRLR